MKHIYFYISSRIRIPIVIQHQLIMSVLIYIISSVYTPPQYSLSHIQQIFAFSRKINDITLHHFERSRVKNIQSAGTLLQMNAPLSIITFMKGNESLFLG